MIFIFKDSMSDFCAGMAEITYIIKHFHFLHISPWSHGFIEVFLLLINLYFL